MPPIKKTVQRLAGVLFVLIVMASAALLWLVVITAPRPGKTMVFEGFIKLPRSRLMNVMDYVSIYGNRLFVTSESSGEVFRVQLGASDLQYASVKTSYGEGRSHGVVLDPNTGKAYATRSGSNHVDVFDPSTLDISFHIPVADDPDGLLYLPDQRLLYAASGDTETATLIDPAHGVPVDSIALGGKPEFAVYDPRTRLIYQNLTDKDEIAVVDPAKQAVVDRWHMSACQEPTGITMDAVARTLFIICSGNSRFVAVDMASHRVIATLPVGGGPDAIAFDAAWHRLYVAGKSGQLDVLQQDAPNLYSSLESIHTHYGAHTLALDPVTHKVYVAYASIFVQPRLAVFRPVH